MRSYLVVDDNRDFAENLAEILRDRGDEVRGGRGRRRRPSELVARPPLRRDAHRHADAGHGRRRAGPRDPADRSRARAAMVITAHVGDDALEAARREGLLAVLPKPVEVPRLLALLAVGAPRRARRRHRGRRAPLRQPVRGAPLARLRRGHRRVGARDRAARAGAAVLRARGPAACPGGPDGEAMRSLGPALPGPADDRRHRPTTSPAAAARGLLHEAVRHARAPRRGRAAPPRPRGRRPAMKEPAQKARILVVDDNAPLVENLARDPRRTRGTPCAAPAPARRRSPSRARGSTWRSSTCGSPTATAPRSRRS